LTAVVNRVAVYCVSVSKSSITGVCGTLAELRVLLRLVAQVDPGGHAAQIGRRYMLCYAMLEQSPVATTNFHYPPLLRTHHPFTQSCMMSVTQLLACSLTRASGTDPRCWLRAPSRELPLVTQQSSQYSTTYTHHIHRKREVVAHLSQ
jgi:hypothetical protein